MFVHKHPVGYGIFSCHACTHVFLQGERKWIGTTEAVALLRSFGVQACIVDFMGKMCMHMLSYLASVTYQPKRAAELYAGKH